MMHILAGFLLALCRGVFWALATIFKSLLNWLVSILWPLVLLAGTLGLLISSARSCEAGWMDWLWGPNQDTEKLRRAADLAGESARIAGQVAAAQAQNATEQARQNTQVAEMLKEFSSERQEYSRQLENLAGIAMRDSEWAAALSAMGPLIICVAVLVVAGLALWLVTRPGGGAGPGFGLGLDSAESLAVDMLLEEIEELARAQVGSRGGVHVGSPSSPHAASIARAHSRPSSRVALPGPVGRLASSDPDHPDG